MTTKAAQKIIDGMTQLLEGFSELEQMVEEDFAGAHVAAAEDEVEAKAEIEAAIILEVKTAVEVVIENESFSAEDMASVVSALTEALEEIDPDVFMGDLEIEEDDDDDDLDDDIDDDEDEDEDEGDDDEDGAPKGGSRRR